MKKLLKPIVPAVLAAGLVVASVATIASAPTNASSSQQQSITATNTSNTQAVSYVYMDTTALALGEQQLVIVGLDTALEPQGATLTIAAEDGDEVSIEAQSITSGAASFAFEPEAVGTYQLCSMEYSFTEGEQLSADLTNSYGQGTFNVASSSDPCEADEGIAAYVVGDSGELEEATSIDAAIQTAQASSSAVKLLSGASQSSTDDYIIVCIDPGHGGSDSGAVGNGLLEKDLTLAISQALKTELQTYSGVSVIMTREGDTLPGLQERADIANAYGADVYVSVHINSADSDAATGFEIYYPNSSSYNAACATAGKALAAKIETQLAALGLYDRGLKVRSSESGNTYPDGSLADYYALIRCPRLYNIPGIIVEHGFINNPSDAVYMASNTQALGEADATGVANYFSLATDDDASIEANVGVTSHVANIGWESTVYDGKTSGTVGKGFDLQAYTLELEDAASVFGGITYRSYVNGSWQGWVADGATSGTTGQGLAVKGIQIKLTGEAASRYSLQYRVHVANVGWLDWVGDGEVAADASYANAVQAIQVKVTLKSSMLSTTAYVGGDGWQTAVGEGNIAGTTGQSKQLEGLKISLVNAPYDGSIEYQAHVQNIGWQDWASNGSLSGTEGQSLRLEAIRIRLSGEMAENYDVYYRAHVQNFGWMGWARNGATAGSSGYAYRVEAIQVCLVPKGSSIPSSGQDAYVVFTPVEVAVPTAVSGLVYNGKQQAGVAEGGDYALSGATATDAGTYTATASLLYPEQSYWPDGTTTDKTISWSIAQANLSSATVTTAKSAYAYTGSAIKPAVTVTCDGQTLSSSDYSVTYSKNTNCGTATVKVTGKGNYTGTAKTTFQIVEASVETGVSYRTHVQNEGWQDWAVDGATSGTSGKSYRLEAIEIKLPGATADQGSIVYNTHVQNIGWQGDTDDESTWKKDGETSGTSGLSYRLEAIQIDLTGAVADIYDVYYRVHARNVGWLDWACNGQMAGTSGYSYRLEAIEIVLVEKGEQAPGATTVPYRADLPNYAVQSEDGTWSATVMDGATAQISSDGSYMTNFAATVPSGALSGSISYQAHVQNIGWTDWISDGEQLDTSEGITQWVDTPRVEAVAFKLTDELAESYDVYYRVYVTDYGWLDWSFNGGYAGTSGSSLPLEALQIKLVEKGGDAPGSTTAAFYTDEAVASVHAQDYGWMAPVTDGAICGTVGEGKRLEAIKITVPSLDCSGSIEYRTHVQNIGWQDWVADGEMAGTSGLSYRLEAIEIQLTGELADTYDVYYRVHAQNFGWMGWACNGESAGTSGYGYRLEAIQIVLMAKGTEPSSTYNGVTSATSDAYSVYKSNAIMGVSETSVAQMVRYWNAVGKSYPSSVYASKGASTITEFCQILYDEAAAEGVRAEVVFAQMVHETGWLQFTGRVPASACNFAGLGAVDGDANAWNTFPDVRTGLRAQVQHLKAYASTDPLNNECVDVRFGLVTRGCAPTVDELSCRWASGSDYGNALKRYMAALLSY